MSGLGLVLSIAKDALAAQQYGMDVTAHNIANVNTPGYSKQTPVYEAKQPAPYGGGVVIGRGVDIKEVLRNSDQFIENQLMRQRSSMSSSKEMEGYIQVLEGLFSESTGTSISAMLSDFWNLWHDIANNPSGASERIALFEHSLFLSQQFNNLEANLQGVETDLTNAIKASVSEVNQITNEIAQLNNRFAWMGSGTIANDLADKRSTLVSKLSEVIDVKTFEQSNGSLTVVTARGCILVQGNASYDLQMGGSDGKNVEWQSSSGTIIDVTNHISNGKLGSCLEARDEVIAKYKLELDAVAREFIWAVNQQHSQGVGQEAFGSVTGTYSFSSTGEAVGAANSGLNFYDKIVDGSFKVWLYDQNGDLVVEGGTTIDIDADVTPIYDTDPLTSDIATKIDEIDADITASITDGKLQISASNGYTFAFSGDTSNVLAALGINTLLSGASASSISVNDKISADKNFIAAAKVNSNGTFASGDNTNALAIADLRYTATDIPQWTCDRIQGNVEGSVTATIEDYYHTMVGSLGMMSASVSRMREFNEVMVNRLEQIRDGISAVSLDEEMTNLVKFQHAYTAAAKLISVSDQMLEVLLNTK